MQVTADLLALVSGMDQLEPVANATICHFFWYSLNASEESELGMRLLNMFAMRSATIHHTVWLWCYQSFTSLPAAVISKDANELLPRNVFERALSNGSTFFANRRRSKVVAGRHVAHLSDLIRVLALRRFGGWWLDMDTIVLKPLPTALPYYFATIPEKRTESEGKGGERLTGRARANSIMWSGHATEQWDGMDSFQNTPIYIAQPEDTLVIEWETRIAPLVLGAGQVEWLEIIRTMESAVIKLHLQQYVCPPELFCPYPFWKTDLLVSPASTASSVMHSTCLPSVDEVMQRSYIIQTFFMSSSSNETARRISVGGDAWLREQLRLDCAFRRLLVRAGIFD